MDEIEREVRETIKSYEKASVARKMGNGQIERMVETPRDGSATRHPLVSKFMSIPKALEPLLGLSLAVPMARLSLDEPIRQPAIEFEAKTGITGIAGHYVMPGALTAQQVENYVMLLDHSVLRGKITHEQQHEKMVSLVAALQGRNPELDIIKYNTEDTFHLRYIAIGATSGFKAGDINSFVNGGTYLKLKNDPAYVALREKLEAQTGVSMGGWIPTMDTLKTIDKKLSLQPAPAPSAKLQAGTPKVP